MLSLIKQFAAAILRQWWGLMSCAAFTILGIVLAQSNKGSASLVAGSEVLAALFFVVAAFLAWREEHQKYLNELAKNQRPDIRGEAFGFLFPHYVEGVSLDDTYVVLKVRFQMALCNHRMVPTDVNKIELDGSSLVPRWIFEDTKTFQSRLDPSLRGDSPSAHPELPMGRSVNVFGEASATVTGPKVNIATLDGTDLTKIRIHLVDSFGGRHSIPVRSGETLRR